MTTQGRGEAPPLSHVPRQPLRCAFDQAGGTRKTGRGGERQERREGEGLEWAGKEAAAKAHRLHTGQRRREPLGLHVKRDKPPIQTSRGNGPLKEILGRVTGRRASQQRNNFLQGGTGHTGHAHRGRGMGMLQGARAKTKREPGTPPTADHQTRFHRCVAIAKV